MVTGFENYVVELDNAVKKAMYGKNHSLDIEFDDPQKQDTKIPEYFPYGDQRQPMKEWLDLRVEEVLRRYFDERSRFQAFLTNEDLVALDIDLANLLTPQHIKNAVIGLLRKEASLINGIAELKAYTESNKDSTEWDMKKVINYQAMVDKMIKNPEAINKISAYGVMLHQKYRDKKSAFNFEVYRKEVEILDRMWDEAQREEGQLPPYSNFTGGVLRLSKKEIERQESINDLKRLRENSLQSETLWALKDILETSHKFTPAEALLEDEIMYAFRRADFTP